MSKLNSTQNSPMKLLFSSVFKREDIRTKTKRQSSAPPASVSTPSYPSNKETDFSSKVLSTDAKCTESRSTLSPIKSSSGSISVEFNCEMKYQDLATRYDRMQDFYRTQVTRLTNEVSHYKILYHKLLLQQSADKKQRVN